MKEHAPRQCLQCGKEFVPVRSTKLYCSNNCRTLATLQRQRAEARGEGTARAGGELAETLKEVLTGGIEREKGIERARAIFTELEGIGKERQELALEGKRKLVEAQTEMLIAEAKRLEAERAKIEAEAQRLRELRLTEVERASPDRLKGILSKKRELEELEAEKLEELEG